MLPLTDPGAVARPNLCHPNLGGATAAEKPPRGGRRAAVRRPSGCGKGLRASPGPPAPPADLAPLLSWRPIQIKPPSTTGQGWGARSPRRGGACARPRPRACVVAPAGGDRRPGRLAGVEPGRRTHATAASAQVHRLPKCVIPRRLCTTEAGAAPRIAGCCAGRWRCGEQEGGARTEMERTSRILVVCRFLFEEERDL